jgi:hypothetical protein
MTERERLIEIYFSTYTAYLKACHDGIRAFAPDVVGRSDELLKRAIYQVTGTWNDFCIGSMWPIPIEKLTPYICRRISETFRKLLEDEQRRLNELTEAIGDPRPTPEPEDVKEEAEAELRMPPDFNEELQRFREEVDRMLRTRKG